MNQGLLNLVRARTGKSRARHRASGYVMLVYGVGDGTRTMDKTYLYVWDDRFLYATPSIKSGPTSRYSITVLLSITGKPFQIGIGGKTVCVQAIVIGPNVERTLDATGSGLLSFNFDPLSYEYHALQRYLDSRLTCSLDVADFNELIPTFRALTKGELTCAPAFRLCNHLVREISDYKPPNIMLDLRVLHVAQRLKAELPLAPTIEELAENVGLSPDRLTHLFTEQLGLSIRSYVLWAKVRRATVLLGSGTPLTDIAQQVGFADSAHLSRTFKEFFGLNPSYIADVRYVRVFDCLGH